MGTLHNIVYPYILNFRITMFRCELNQCTLKETKFWNISLYNESVDNIVYRQKIHLWKALYIDMSTGKFFYENISSDRI